MRSRSLFALASLGTLIAAGPAAAAGYDHVLSVAADRSPVTLRVGPGDTMTWLSLLKQPVWVELRRQGRRDACPDGRRDVRMLLLPGSSVKSCWLHEGVYEYRVLASAPRSDGWARTKAIELLLADHPLRPLDEQARAEEHERVRARREARDRAESRDAVSFRRAAVVGTSLLGTP